MIYTDYTHIVADSLLELHTGDVIGVSKKTILELSKKMVIQKASSAT